MAPLCSSSNPKKWVSLKLRAILDWFMIDFWVCFLICILCHHSDPMSPCVGSFSPHFQCEWSQRAEMVYCASFAGSFATLNSPFYRGAHPKLSGVTQLLCAEERRLQTICLFDNLLCFRCIRSPIIGMHSECHVTWRALLLFDRCWGPE